MREDILRTEPYGIRNVMYNRVAHQYHILYFQPNLQYEHTTIQIERIINVEDSVGS